PGVRCGRAGCGRWLVGVSAEGGTVMSRVIMSVAWLLLSAVAVSAQTSKPTAAIAFARQYVAMSVPGTDTPDRDALACLAVVDRIRGTSFAGYLVSGLQGDRNLLQEPAALLPAITALLAKEDLHGQLRSQLRWYYH